MAVYPELRSITITDKSLVSTLQGAGLRGNYKGTGWLHARPLALPYTSSASVSAMTSSPAWIGGLTMGPSRKGLARQFVELLDCVTSPSLVLEMSSRG